MRKFALAAVSTLLVVGFVVGEEFNLTITKINSDGTITGTKGGGFGGGAGKGKGKGGAGGKAEEVTIKIAPNVEVYKGKFDADTKGFVKDGDNLKIAELKSHENVTVTVGGKALEASDSLSLTIKDGKKMAMLNGKDVDINTVRVTSGLPLATRVTTSDDGTVTTIILTGGGGGFGGKGKKGK